MIDLIKKNIKFIVLMLVVIILGIIGIAYAIKVANFNPIALNVTSAPIDVNITYDSSANGASITSSGKMVPIDDSLVTGVNVSDERVIKAKFKVAGVSSNPNNTIYDVALRDINIDCDLRTEDVKWRLYKNGTLLTSGNLSPTFDVMSDNRLVLTDTQQDLTTTTDEYVFLLWISESCTGDISTCSKEQEQNKYLNKFFSASIKLEMSTKAKKTLVRNTASADSCSFSTTSVPVFNSLTYNGSEQTLINSGTGYTLVNNTGTNAGEYVVTAKLDNGYKWSDGTTNDKVIKGKINKKKATIVASDQSISYGGSINSTKYTTLDFLSGHSVSSVFLNTSTVDVGVGTITPTSARIVDSKGNDVTDNYNLSYVSGTLTIDCSSSSNITIDLPSTLTYGTSGTYTYTVSPTNLLVSCTSSDTSIATCSVDTTNKKVTITPKGTGSVNITLNGEVPNSNDECSSVNISKAITINCSNTATEPIVTSSQDYTGSIRIGVSGGANVDLGGTLSATDVGTYTGTATPSKGYCWSDNTNSSKSYNWTISKIADPITITSTTATYDGNTHAATAKSVSGTAVTLTYYSDSSCSTKTNTTNANSTGGAPKNAGTYYAIGETSGTNNYNASISSCTKAVTINKISPTISLSATSGNVNYNDTNTFTATTKSPISSSVAGTLTATSADTSYVTITGGASSSITATSSGVNTTITYKGVKGTNNSTAITIEFVPDDSTNFNTVTATYNVSKVSQLPGSISLSEKTATYTGSAIIANTATTNSGGTVTYVYYSDNSCNTKTTTSTGASSEGKAPIDAGTYYVKATVTSTENYTSASTGCIKHTINKKSVAVTWGDTTTFTYNNTAQAPTATATSEITGETINVTRTTGKNAGSYTSTASCSRVTGGRAKCDNYNLTNSTKGFTINKATPTISLSATSGDVNYNDTKTFTATTKSPISSNVAGTLTATSGGTSYVTITGGASSSITATSSGVNTTITYKGAGGTTSATTITVKFTPSDTTNFNTVTKTYSVTAVKSIPNTLSVTAKTGLSYNGSAQTLATVSNAQGTVYYSTSTELTSSNYSSGSTTISTGTNAGTYTVYYYTPGNANYQAKSGSVSVKISKVSPTISLSATSGDVDYNATKTFTATTKSPISSNVAGTLTATSGGTSYVTITGGASSSITATSSGVNTTITYKGAGGTTSATTITVKFTPSDTTNFNTVTKTYSVTAVNKIASTCTISSTPTLKYPGSKTGTFSYSCTGDGSLSLTSSNTSVISVGTVGTTSTTLTAKAIGSSTLTLKQSEGTNYLASSPVTKSITVSASTYTLTYDNNGGSGCSTTSVTYGGTYGTMCEPTRRGYIFIGWFDENYKDKPLNYYADTYSDLKNAFGYDADALYNHYITYGKGEGRRISQYVKGDSFTGNANKTIYAGWYAQGYTISYNSNGGTGSMAADVVKTGGTATIKANEFTKKGYMFAGWTTKNDGTDDGYGWTGWSGTWNYVDGQYGIANNTLKLYARWTPKSYTISYNSNGGTGTMASDTVSTGGKATIKSNTFTRTGYKFVGWTTKSDGTDDGYGWTGWSGTWNYDNGQYGIANNSLVLYARWDNHFTVTYNNNGGSGCTSKTVTYGSTYGTMCTPTREGYIFVGWFDSSYKDAPLNYYADTYSDLYNAFGYDANSLYNHYLTYGESGGRRISQYISTDTFNTASNKTIYAGWALSSVEQTVTTYSCPADYTCSGGTCTSSSKCEKTVTGEISKMYYCPHDNSYQTSSTCSYTGWENAAFDLGCSTTQTCSDSTYSCPSGTTLNGTNCYMYNRYSCRSGYTSVKTGQCEYSCGKSTGLLYASCSGVGTCKSNSAYSCVSTCESNDPNCRANITLYGSGPYTSCRTTNTLYNCYTPATVTKNCVTTGQYYAGSYRGCRLVGSDEVANGFSCSSGNTGNYNDVGTSSCSVSGYTITRVLDGDCPDELKFDKNGVKYCDTANGYWKGKSCTSGYQFGASAIYKLTCSKTGSLRYYCDVTDTYSTSRPSSCSKVEYVDIESSTNTIYICPANSSTTASPITDSSICTPN